MVEQLPVDREHVVRLAVIPSDPVAVHLCRAVRTTWIKRCVLVLRRWARPKHLACACLVKANTGVHTSDGFQQIQRRDPRCPRRVQGFVERNADMRLRGEVVDLVRSEVGYELMHARGIGHVTVMEMQTPVAVGARWPGSDHRPRRRSYTVVGAVARRVRSRRPARAPLGCVP